MTQPLLSVNHLTVRYDDYLALDDIHFDVQRGDSIAVIGPNGAGKSTLMKAIMGLIQPQRGAQINFAPDVSTPGYVPQHQEVAWDFPVTVEDVVMMGLTRQIGWLRRPNQTHQKQVDSALERVGMLALAHRQIGELSGGQKQRVFIARALVRDVDILLLDEPFAGVDAAAQSEVMEVIDRVNCEGMTILLSTHDLGLAFQRFKKVMALNHHLVAYGPASEIYTSETLRGLYGGGIAAVQDGERVTMFVDEHGCAEHSAEY
jgi:ABC-type Mn2+/Zn2+ transport system ATPase subunit